MNDDMSDNKLLLRAILKAFTALSALGLAYILFAGLFSIPELETNGQYVFDVSELPDNSARYFAINRRDVLVIKQQGVYYVFWANDPVYGCRLEYANAKIKPVCINLEYNLHGYNSAKNQQLNFPKHKITAEQKLIIF